MEEKYLGKVLPFLKELDQERRELFEEYFSSAPVWLLDSLQVVEVERGVTLVRENTPVDMVYIIGRGAVKGVDFRIYGVEYDFMHFEGVYGMGAMEIIMHQDVYRTTLETTTPCTVIKIPKAKFEKWLDSDIKALRQEAEAVGNYLLEEVRNSRLNLFLKGTERLAILFTSYYDKYAKDGILKVTQTRTELSENTGLCVKTVNRSIKKFEEEKMVGRDGSKITINEEQYEKLKALVRETIDQ
ncbi:MAG: Crp/Fnr family transcriptional regulator [Roseburia sp.]